MKENTAAGIDKAAHRQALREQKSRFINRQAVKAMQDDGLTWYIGTYLPTKNKHLDVQLMAHQKGLHAFVMYERASDKGRGGSRAGRFKMKDRPIWAGNMFFAMDSENPNWRLIDERPQIFTSVKQMHGRRITITGKGMMRFVSYNETLFSSKGVAIFSKGQEVEALVSGVPVVGRVVSLVGKKAKIATELFGGYEAAIPIDKLREIS